MKAFFVWALAASFALNASAQSVSERLAKAWTAFEADSQLRSAIASLYVVDGSSGAVLFDRNSRIGLAPASTQKIITAAAAYALLGNDFRYITRFGLLRTKPNDTAAALQIFPSGDPTLGSSRWPETDVNAVIHRTAFALQKTGIKRLSVATIDERGWSEEATPGGWIWDDVGNYYGAGARAFNWSENQYDLYLRSGPSLGDDVQVLGTKPTLVDVSISSMATAAAKGTGDNAYIYFVPGTNELIVRGTIPVGEERFAISGATPSPTNQFAAALRNRLRASKAAIEIDGMIGTINGKWTDTSSSDAFVFHTETSPPLDSISYWFLKRSINLYGEALLKTMAVRARGSIANAESSLRNFWVEKGLGIDKTELNLHDGSGLSPLNRVTTHAQVSVLQYAQKQPWFNGYVNGFPEYNAMKLKSGTINGVKSFCGYHTSKEGKPYILSFIVNNYNGSSSSLVQKMYKVLDLLK